MLSVDALRELELSPVTIRDYLAISSPGLPEEAGFGEAEIDALTPTTERTIGAAIRKMNGE